jgi:hypothetical protein
MTRKVIIQEIFLLFLLYFKSKYSVFISVT